MTKATPVLSTKHVVGVLGGLGVGAVGGFVASLLWGRPPSIYAARLQPGRPYWANDDDLPRAEARDQPRERTS